MDLARTHRLQFRLRAFLLAISALAAGLGVVVGRVHRQRSIVDAIEARGGSVGYYAPPTLLPECLYACVIRWLGRDYMHRPTVVHLYPPRGARANSGARFHRERLQERGARDRDVVALAARLSTLLNLDLCNSLVSDGDLQHISGCLQLTVIDAPGTRIGDAGIERLRPLTRLEFLDLSETAVTDFGLRNITRMRNLQDLRLAGTCVSDVGLRCLSGLPLITLNLDFTCVTGRGCEAIAPREGWLDLSLQGCAVDDEGLRCIVGLPQLRRLVLSDTQITDAGLAHLNRLGDGCVVCLYGTSITDAGLRQLRGRKANLLLLAADTGVTERGAGDLNRASPGCVVCLDPRPRPATPAAHE